MMKENKVELNGKAYESVYLTEEEVFVINELRKGAHLSLFTEHDTLKEAKEASDRFAPEREQSLLDTGTYTKTFWTKDVREKDVGAINHYASAKKH